jgi:probable F420-dependent oxidoreductase
MRGCRFASLRTSEQTVLLTRQPHARCSPPYKGPAITDEARAYRATKPAASPPRVLAALGPRMLALAAQRAQGAHPYLVTPDHTAKARDVFGSGPWLLPEQAVVLATNPDQARVIARRHISRYLDLPNYVNNWRRLGFTDDDLWVREATVWSMRSSRGVTWKRSANA